MCSTALCWICFAALETAVADVCPPQLPLHMSSAAATACQWLLLQQDQLLHLWLWGRQINIAQANSARTLHVLSNFQSKCLTRTKRFPTHCKTGNWEHTETPQSYPQHCSVIQNLWLSTIEPLGVVNCAYSTITELILDFLLHPWNSCHSSVRLLLTPCMTFTCEIMMALHLNACPDAASSSSPLKRSLWVDFYPLPPPKVSPEPDLCPWGVG